MKDFEEYLILHAKIKPNFYEMYAESTQTNQISLSLYALNALNGLQLNLIRVVRVSQLGKRLGNLN